MYPYEEGDLPEKTFRVKHHPMQPMSRWRGILAARLKRVGGRLEDQISTCLGVLLLVTALAKVVGVTYGPERVLSQLDWLLQIRMRWVLILAAAVEVVIGWILLAPAKKSLRCISGFAFFAWLGTYRLFRSLLGAPDPDGCGCLGYITDAIGIPHYLAEKWLSGFVVFGLAWFSFQVAGYLLGEPKRATEWPHD
ncbi:hypothetical protein [Limisphaera sp. VF-2]|uniref:hypothetical protein n=1 Tax=Limisphaera sp. VF-2 TaxID=3400418 RepID=UPI001777637A